VDVIVFATGFQVDRTNMSNTSDIDDGSLKNKENKVRSPYQLDIIGVNSYSSNDWSREGPKAYLGITYPAFPNMFFLLGPNTVNFDIYFREYG
jgi:cation diffusion facilitator CzcD-associated flavoprotein CzcO